MVMDWVAIKITSKQLAQSSAVSIKVKGEILGLWHKTYPRSINPLKRKKNYATGGQFGTDGAPFYFIFFLGSSSVIINSSCSEKAKLPQCRTYPGQDFSPLSSDDGLIIQYLHYYPILRVYINLLRCVLVSCCCCSSSPIARNLIPAVQLFSTVMHLCTIKRP